MMPSVRDYFEVRRSTTGDVLVYIAQELPEYMQRILPLSAASRDNLIAGMGMGGYYALKTAVKCPERFGSAGVLGGLPDVKSCLWNQPEGSPERLLCEGFETSGQDVIELICSKKQEGKALPRLFFQYPEEERNENDRDVWRRFKEAGIEVTKFQGGSLEKSIEYFVQENAGGIYG